MNRLVNNKIIIKSIIKSISIIKDKKKTKDEHVIKNNENI